VGGTDANGLVQGQVSRVHVNKAIKLSGNDFLLGCCAL
jgi:hypothetical protein